MQAFLESVGGRKFVAFLVAVATAIVMRYTDALDQSNFVTIFITAFGAFIAGNVGSDVAAIFTKPAPPPPPAPPVA
jgi:hypothetical protein